MNIPSSLEECFLQLEKAFSSEERQLFMEENESGEGDVFQFHSGLGRWIRNHWGLWKQEGPLYEQLKVLGLEHADDMSSLILTSFWRSLHGRPLGVKQQVEKHQAYWKRVADAEHLGYWER